MFNDNNSIEVRDRIVETARELFVKNGYNGTSVRDIANASDTNVAMVNYYFGSKYNLFGQIFEESFNFLANKVFSTLTSDLPFFELVEVWINSYYEVLSECPQIPNFLLNEVSVNPEHFVKLMRDKNPLRIYSVIRKRIKDEAAKGTIKDTSPDDFLLSVLSLGIFPFIFANMASIVFNMDKEKYIKMLDQHKTYVVKFVIDALKP